jgi:D-cysteine desulfhydrase
MEVKTPERRVLGLYPTPIQKLERLSEELGGPEIYVKRDDMNEFALSGNKLRKLEFVLPYAISQGCDAVITYGAVTSNHCRITAGAAARLGLGCELMLRGHRPELYEGNSLLNYLFGANMTFTGDKSREEASEMGRQLTERYASEGRKLFDIPIGASTSLGCWGYVEAAREIAEQQKEMGVTFDRIVCTFGSGGTIGGLWLGGKMYGLSAELLGIYVGGEDGYDQFQKQTEEIIAGFIDAYAPGLPYASIDDLNITDAYRGIDYGVNTAEEIASLELAARLDAVVFDPVYCGKALHGMIEEIRKGNIGKNEKVLIIHTGGVFAMFPKNKDILPLSAGGMR